VARDLGAAGQRSQVGKRQARRPLDQAADLEPIVDKAGSRESLVLAAVGHRRAIATEFRRSIGVAEFLRHRLARQQEVMRGLTQPFAGAEHLGKPLGSRESVATG
jgi:hypothetical protein